MSTKFPYKYNKLAAAIFMMAPIAVANAVAPVFIENSVLESELEFLFHPTNSNSEHIHMAFDEDNNLYTAAQRVVFANKVSVSKLTSSSPLNANWGILPSDLGLVTATGNLESFSQIAVSPLDGKIIVAALDGSSMLVQTSIDGGDTWTPLAVQPVVADATDPVTHMQMEVDSLGNIYLLYVSFLKKSEVLKFDGSSWSSVSGIIGVFVAGGGGAKTAMPAGIALSPDDRLHYSYRPALGDNVNLDYIEDNGAWVSSKVLIATPQYVRPTFDNAGNLYLTNSANGTSGLNVFKITNVAPTTSTHELVGNGALDRTSRTTGTTTNGIYIYDLEFDSKNKPYIAFRQENNSSATRRAVLVHLVDNAWTEIPWNVDEGSEFKAHWADDTKSGSTIKNKAITFMDLAIDNYDRPLISLRGTGSHFSNAALTLRINLTAGTSALVPFTLNEGEAVVGTLKSVDADRDNITYALTGADAELFTIDTTGEISFTTVPVNPTENLIYRLTVSATANGDSTEQAIEITLINDTTNDLVNTDGDEILDDRIDPDDDNDGYSDIDEISAGSDPLDNTNIPDDNDGDFISDVTDTDDDNDGLLDSYEEQAEVCTDPLLADTDGDGSSDKIEIEVGTDPCIADVDTDDDGVSDFYEGIDGTDPHKPDTDDDGLTDGEEKIFGSNPLEADSDNDGLTDIVEQGLSLNPNLADTDNDGISDIDEIIVADDGTITFITDPNDADSDDDGLTDGQELNLGTDPNKSDSDNDGLTDAQEVALQTNPNSADSDNDGLTDAEEVALQTNPNSADSDNDGLNDSVDAVCPLVAGDCTEPSFPEGEQTISFDATDHLTNITAAMIADKVTALNIVVTDVLDDDVVIAQEHISYSTEEFSSKEFKSGQYNELITLTVTDSEDFTVTKAVKLTINPVVKIPSNLAVEPGQTQVEIPLRVLGSIPTDSSQINYSVDVQGVVTEGILVVTAAIPASEDSNGEVIAASAQVVESIFIDVSEDAVHGEEIVITLLESEHVSILANSQLVVKVIAENKAPRVSLVLQQESAVGLGDYETVSRITPSLGYVKVVAVVKDVNALDEHDINFSVSNDLLVNMPDANPDAALETETETEVIVDEHDYIQKTFVFDASNLDPLDYQISVSAIENNTSDLYQANASILLPVDKFVANATLSIDSDQDGIADVNEFAGFENDNNRLYFAGGDTNIQRVDSSTGSGALRVTEGLSFKLGQFAHAKLQRKADGSVISGTTAQTPNLQPNADGLISINDDIDHKFKNPLTTVTNFIVDGLAVNGDSVSIVMPLINVVKQAQTDEEGNPVVKVVNDKDVVQYENIITDVTIPAGAVYRKYTPADGWFTFVEDENNSIASAMKDEFGNCPAPSAADYYDVDGQANGLIVGNQCIQLTIEDGGNNDADGLANASVEDPGFLATQDENRAPTIDSLIPVSAVSGENVSITVVASDADEDELSYQWVQLGDQTVSIDDASAQTISFTAPTVSETTILSFAVTATDSAGASSVQQQVELTVTSVVDDKPEADQDRSAGSFGWLLAFTSLFAVIRRKRKS
jgi:hypothetical protein